MSKLSNVLKMLILLKSNGKMKAKQLAEELEVDERMIRKYKQELEMAGIYLTTICGVNGGYILGGNCFLEDFKINNEEKKALDMVRNQLTKDNFLYYKDANIAISKILNIDSEKNRIDYMIKDTKANINTESEKKRWEDINFSIITHNKIKIVYKSLQSGRSERIVQPYGVFSYEGAMYFIGYCEKRNAIREFKLSRIIEYEQLNDKFEIPRDFNIKGYMRNSIGIYHDEEIFVKLKIKYPMSQIISEKIITENQKINKSEDKSIIFEAVIKDKTDLKSWILSMGSSVEIIEPNSLKEEILNELQNTINLYKI